MIKIINQLSRRFAGVRAGISDFSKVREKALAKGANVAPKRAGPADTKQTDKNRLPENFHLNEAARVAFEAIQENSPVVFVTGRAGTGKTTFIEYVRVNLNRNIVVLAPTGIAALNVLGQTIHSFFKFPPRLFDNKEIKPRNDTVIDRLELLVLDEISMVRADMIDHIDFALRKWRNRNEPFGGVQVLLTGDCLQLPPIVNNEERDTFEREFRTPWFFGAKVFDDLPVFAVELSVTHRQRDAHFIDLLDSIRTNENHRDAVAELNRRCYRDRGQFESALTLTATNSSAESINQTHLDALMGEARLYKGKTEGTFGLSDQRLPSPERLMLKPGAQVMVTKNVSGAVNGSLGLVDELGEHSIRICLSDSDEIITITREKWHQYAYRWSDESQAIKATEIGSYEQFPLRLGWAITIHKSQGLTLDSVRIDLGRGAFAAGQTYVALSRCRSINDIELARPIAMRDVRADPIIIDFHNSLFGESGDSPRSGPIPAKVDQIRLSDAMEDYDIDAYTGLAPDPVFEGEGEELDELDEQEIPSVAAEQDDSYDYQHTSDEEEIDSIVSEVYQDLEGWSRSEEEGWYYED